jgi:hypothetical protein
VYPASEIRFSRFVALRIARTSACALGSFSCFTAFNARSNTAPVFVSTIEAPNGRGLSVCIDRAVNATSAVMRSMSRPGPLAAVCFPFRTFLSLEGTPILELSMVGPLNRLNSGFEIPSF